MARAFEPSNAAGGSRAFADSFARHRGRDRRRHAVAFCEREAENALRIAMPGRHQAIPSSAQREEQS
ncbi:hypothetical protein CO709_17605 [Burkholderia thailandensis]|nr:hypothetical protein CO709_17605 [Burkholderia thailandensis]